MATPSQGTVLRVESATPSTFTAVGEITAINGPQGSVTVLDVTNMSDTIRRRSPGLLEPGQVQVELQLNHGDAGQDRVRTVWAAKTRVNWEIVIPAGQMGSGTAALATTQAFSGFVSAMATSASLDGIYRMTLTITIDSAVTETP
jgi:predicted secreted protein